MNLNKVIALISINIFCLLITSCTVSPVQTSGGASGTEISACVISGIAIDSSGNALRNAIVHLRKSNYLSPVEVDSNSNSTLLRRSLADTVTGNDGTYYLDYIDTGTYTIEIIYNDTLGVTHNVPVSQNDTIVTLPPDTLRPLSVVAGRVVVYDTVPGQSKSPSIRVYGLERCIRPDSTNRFNLIVPAGKYNLNFSTGSNDTDQVELSINVLPNSYKDIGSLHLNESRKRFSPCFDYSCDSLCVRNLLDSQGYENIPVDSVSQKRDNRIVELDLHGLNITQVPGLVQLEFLEVLDLSYNNLTDSLLLLRLPKNLSVLNLEHNRLSGVHRSISYFSHLTYIDISDNEIMSLPSSIVCLDNLLTLDVSNNRLIFISPEIEEWLNRFDNDWRSTQRQ